ncbi:hypothetical protein NP493_848g03113 [Ridgeia piscesae]|uniref:Integrase zinc-binding domain-containing protein n=1 Tax=Ridgeia piscesae TaxID=27915 RepID=A0AAD9KME0_RIDPI|nr:hypothetical protein NP493_848g03113 [Ridgeia piscesae]
MEGWPYDRRRVPDRLLPYVSYRDELTIQDGVIFRGERIVITSSLRKSMKEKVRAGHIGLNSSLRRARHLISWPQMSTDIRHYVETCGVCATYADKEHAELMVMTETPDLPGQKVGTDLFSWSGKDYNGNNRLPQRFLRVRLPTRHDLRNRVAYREIEHTFRKPSVLRQTQPQLNNRKLQLSHRIHVQSPHIHNCIPIFHHLWSAMESNTVHMEPFIANVTRNPAFNP